MYTFAINSTAAFGMTEVVEMQEYTVSSCAVQ